MANRLWNSLTFTDVAPAATVSLPHLLNNTGENLLPDFGWVDNDAFIPSATTTQVSVTNNSAVMATVHVMVCAIHTGIRVLGGTNVPNLAPKPFWVVGSMGGTPSGSTPSNCLIFQPGGAQTGPVIFNSWAALMSQLALLRLSANGGGCYVIQFDNSFTSPAVIPAGGPYNMTDVTWEGLDTYYDGPTGVLVSVADGASFTGLRRFGPRLFIDNLNTVTPPCLDLVSNDQITVDGSSIESLGGIPFFRTSGIGAGSVVIHLIDSARLLFGPFIHAPNVGTSVSVNIDSVAYFGATFAPIGDPTVFTGVVGTTLVIRTPSLATIPTVFAGWLGVISVLTPGVSPSLLPQPYLTPPGTAAAANFGMWSRITAAGGAVALTLFSINGAPASFRGPGTFLLVSEQGGGQQLQISPAAGDTINGAAGARAVPAGGSILLISDGVSNWVYAADYGNQRFSPPEQWNQNNVAASQTNVALETLVSANFPDIKMIRAGSIVGLSTRLTEAITAGTLTVKVTKNGLLQTLEVFHTSVSNPSGGQATQLAGLDRFVAGDRIGIVITTNGAFLPNTTDLEAWLEIEEVPS